MKFNIHTLYGFIFKFTRKRRMSHFQAVMQPASDTHILDVGGYPFNWKFLNPTPKVSLLNVSIANKSSTTDGQFTYVQGDGRALSYNNQSFDVAFSNSVIEHVGDWQDQKRFANEIRRVGKSVWVQTPARCFPLEPHFLALFAHWFPYKIRKPLLRWVSLRRLIDLSATESDALADEIRLLSFSEMKELFHDCEIYIERFLGIPKSYIAIRK